MSEQQRVAWWTIAFAIFCSMAFIHWAWIALAAWVVVLFAVGAWQEAKRPEPGVRLVEAPAEPAAKPAETAADRAAAARAARRTRLW
jgi:hypothetical protein